MRRPAALAGKGVKGAPIQGAWHWVAGRCLPKHLEPLAGQLSELGLGLHLDSALGCHAPESGLVAFLPSFLPLVSAGEAAGQQHPELCLEHASPWHRLLLPSEHLPLPCSYGRRLRS